MPCFGVIDDAGQLITVLSDESFYGAFIVVRKDHDFPGRVAGKVPIITGGASGIGEATVKRLSQDR